MANQSAGNTSSASVFDPNSSQHQEADDSTEFQDPKEFVENLQLELSKWIDGLRKTKRSTTADRDVMKLSSLEKSLNQVQVALRHLKQNVDIPEVHLDINEHIKQIVETAKAQGKKPNAADLGELIQDSEFLNSLQSGVNKWIEAIRKVTRMDRDPSSGTALQEATFWMNLEKALSRIQEMRESDEVIVTLEALKAGKRLHATVSFDSDTGLKERLANAQDHNQLMKDIPLNDLLAATNLDEIRLAVANICGSLKKIRNTKYPLKRAIQFFTTISTDLCEQIIQLLKPRLLMHAPMSELDEIAASCPKIWGLWDDEADKIKSIFRDIGKKQRSDAKFLHRVPNRHKELEKRLEELYRFRKQHEQLSNVITRVLRSTGTGINSMGAANNPEKEVIKAYEAVKEVDYLDLSQAGHQAWESAIQYYREHIRRIETQLASQLREQLGAAAAKSADEMFSICSRYNALFVRPYIRTAIKEHQATLIELVKADIIELQESILNHGKKMMALQVAGNYDIPDFSAKVMWLKQNEYLLNMNIKRIEDVLGEQWTNHLEGKELKKECDLLRQKLDTNLMFKEWSEKVLSKCKTSTEKLFCVEKQQRDGKIISLIRVNFTPDSIKISKEARNLKNMGFRIPFKIMTYSHNKSAYYPYAISLLESVRIYEATSEIVTNRQGIETLVAGHQKNIHELFGEGYKTDWSHFKLEGFAHKFSEAVDNYQEKVTDLIECLDKIDVELSALDICQYKQEIISQILGTIQKTVDQMALNNYSNLNKWIDNLDKTLEAKLARRVEEAIHIWTTELKQKKNELEDEREANIVPEIQKINLEIRIVSQFITVVPTLEKAKDSLFEQFSAWHSIITDQPRISCNRFQTFQQNQDTLTYKSVLMNPKNHILTAVFEVIDAVVKKTDDYVNQWTRYQSLWDLQPEIFLKKLGTNLSNWMKFIMEMKKARAMVYSPKLKHQIFPFVVDYTRVQQKIALRYDYWQREVQQKFGVQLGNQMQNFYTEISKARSELETQSIDSANTSDTIALITHVQNLKKQLKTSQEEVNKYVTGQKLLATNRYTFPQSWLYAERVEGEWSALQDILNRKDVAIQSQVPNLQTKIMEEDKLLEKNINDVMIAELMRQIREHWTDFIVKLVDYQQKTKLIIGWDDLFNKLKEHMNSLKAMKLSPDYEQFEVDALSWKDKLNRIHSLFDVWIDVQRRWVYLEGLFAGSADIAHLLPTETSRFSNVSSEFLGLMQKVDASPRIIDVIEIEEVKKILERLADLLSTIEKNI